MIADFMTGYMGKTAEVKYLRDYGDTMGEEYEPADYLTIDPRTGKPHPMKYTDVLSGKGYAEVGGDAITDAQGNVIQGPAQNVPELRSQAGHDEFIAETKRLAEEEEDALRAQQTMEGSSPKIGLPMEDSRNQPELGDRYLPPAAVTPAPQTEDTPRRDIGDPTMSTRGAVWEGGKPAESMESVLGRLAVQPGGPGPKEEIAPATDDTSPGNVPPGAPEYPAEMADRSQFEEGDLPWIGYDKPPSGYYPISGLEGERTFSTVKPLDPSLQSPEALERLSRRNETGGPGIPTEPLPWWDSPAARGGATGFALGAGVSALLNFMRGKPVSVRRMILMGIFAGAGGALYRHLGGIKGIRASGVGEGAAPYNPTVTGYSEPTMAGQGGFAPGT